MFVWMAHSTIYNGMTYLDRPIEIESSLLFLLSSSELSILCLLTKKGKKLFGLSSSWLLCCGVCGSDDEFLEDDGGDDNCKDCVNRDIFSSLQTNVEFFFDFFPFDMEGRVDDN